MTHRLALALALPLLIAAGCAEDGPDAADPSAASTATADESQLEDIDYPDEGVDLVDRPELEGAYQQALQTYVDFERGRRQAAREGEVGRLLSLNGTASVVDPYREAFAAYSDGTYDGDVVIEFLEARPRDTVLRLDICVDATRLVVPDGAPTQLGEATRAPQRIEVTNILGPWRVTEVASVDGSC
ncbi:hypothetical protein [Nocardioides bizhenqiangii]|uniref:Lipoprotein n=1 Tax=Nocardioides bizhenqiangii TaxID=3095076 RepID=A0ABZ0ZRS6_9ACTN|nr:MULTISPECIES: hypothetical protein [unclassified Nocardioides]MDZ5622777.1 hypothetical protein [Nocardioides sp. HM23]WQQ27039.1 hypothetical protein SHK19_02135 [Nocardioides sp. HM61]